MTQKVIAVYPGSFDPPTLGHIDVIERAVRIFGGLRVVIASSSRKTSLFEPDERKSLLEKSLSHLKNVVVEIHDGLTVDYVRSIGGSVIIRGLRAVSDFEYELQMASMNRKLAPGIETLIVMTDEKYNYIASNTVKEVAMHGADVSALVPKAVVAALKERLK